MLGTPAPTGREKPARLPLYLGFYQAIMVENWKETDTMEAKTLPLVGRTIPAHKGCSVRCGRGSSTTLVPVRVNHACPKAPVLEQPNAKILVSPSWVPKAPLAATGAAGTGTEQEQMQPHPQPGCEECARVPG